MMVSCFPLEGVAYSVASRMELRPLQHAHSLRVSARNKLHGEVGSLATPFCLSRPSLHATAPTWSPQWKLRMEFTNYVLHETDHTWSTRLESVRKNDECFFGIPKGRSKLLKLPINFEQKDRRNGNVFFASCTPDSLTVLSMGGMRENRVYNWQRKRGGTIMTVTRQTPT